MGRQRVRAVRADLGAKSVLGVAVMVVGSGFLHKMNRDSLISFSHFEPLPLGENTQAMRQEGLQ